MRSRPSPLAPSGLLSIHCNAVQSGTLSEFQRFSRAGKTTLRAAPALVYQIIVEVSWLKTFAYRQDPRSFSSASRLSAMERTKQDPKSQRGQIRGLGKGAIPHLAIVYESTYPRRLTCLQKPP
jgi:hypothetical protein